MQSPDNRAVLQALGLSRKAGKTVIGTEAVCASLREKIKPFAVFLANDNAQATDKRLLDKCKSYRVPIYRIPAGGAELAHALGKGAHTAAVAVTDEHLCQLAIEKLRSQDC